MNAKFYKGFSLIETIIYIGLFSVIMTGAFVAAYELLVAGNDLNSKTEIQNEEDFVLHKIDWAMSNIKEVENIKNHTLEAKKLYYGQDLSVMIKFDPTEKRILMKTGGNLLPINGKSKITKLEFQHISETAITANITINGADFTITKIIK